MKLAIFYPRSTLAGWYALGGYAATLRRMGHKVLDCALPGNQVQDPDHWRTYLPDLETLAAQDAILSLYHEYTQPWLKAIYGDAWHDLAPPVIARFDESMDRRDLALAARADELLRWADRLSFPAAQDAARYGGQWLPFGADRTMFCPAHRQPRRYGVGFIGSMYQARIDYLTELARQASNSIVFNCAPVFVRDLGGIREPESTRLLVENYRSLRIFFCLPPLSSLIVAKVFDVMACGTFVMYPRLPGGAAKNLEIFQDGVHLAYYEPGYMLKNEEQIRYWLEHDEEREAVARAGCRRVMDVFTLERMLEGLLTLVPNAVTRPREEVPA